LASANSGSGAAAPSYAQYVAAISITRAARRALTDAYQPGSGVSAEMLNGLVFAYHGAINAERAARDVALGGMETALSFSTGDKVIPGRLYSGTTGVSRVVRLYDQDSGEMVDTTISDDTGHFAFTNIVPGDYYMTAHDFSGLAGERTSSVIENISA
jgi:hypothetical protein